MAENVEHCPHCEVAAVVVKERRAVPLGQRRFEIDDEFYRCSECGEEFYTAQQADARERQAIATARAEDRLLTPDQIRAIREGLRLSQRDFELLLGVGEKTCVRWEQGRVCQNVSTDRLIRLLAADPENIRLLAAINGVSLPESYSALAAFNPGYRHIQPDAHYVMEFQAFEYKLTNARATRVMIGGSSERSISNSVETRRLAYPAPMPVPERRLSRGVIRKAQSVGLPLVSGSVQ